MLSHDDHRRLGQELDLFHLQDEAPGAVFWHPRGLAIVRALEGWLRQVAESDGYREVRTPQVMSRAIWSSSGHWQNFAAGMMKVPDEARDERDLALKPVNCPGHVQIAMDARLSHRHLPLRLSELGVVHRREPSGVLHGLFRLRQFTQDDGHVFCAEEDVRSELLRFLKRVKAVYASVGFDEVDVALSTRPEVRAGRDADWDRAEEHLQRAAEEAGFSPRHQPGEGAFYGPKIELVLRDHAGRAWQCGTIQVDYVMPARFGASYVGSDGRRHPLVMIHRALLGSLERFAGILLEHHGGRLPGWLAPVSVRVLPVQSAQRGHGDALLRELREHGVRAELDAHDAPLSQRVHDARHARVPWLAVLGAREVKANQVAVRSLHASALDADATKDEVLARDQAVGLIAGRCAAPRV